MYAREVRSSIPSAEIDESLSLLPVLAFAAPAFGMGTLVKPIDFLALGPFAARDLPPVCGASSDDESDKSNNGRLAFACKRGADAAFDDEATGEGPGRLPGGLAGLRVLLPRVDKRGFGAGAETSGAVGVLNNGVGTGDAFTVEESLVGRLLAEDESLRFVNKPSPRVGAAFDLSTSFPFILAVGLEAAVSSSISPVSRGLAEDAERGVFCCETDVGLEVEKAGLSERAGGDRKAGSGSATSLSSWKTKSIGFDFLVRFLATCMRGRMLSRGEGGGCDEGGGTIPPRWIG